MFKGMVGLIGAALVVAMPISASAAEEWVFIGGNKNAAVFLDVNGIARDGDVANGWARVQLRKGDRSPSGKKYNEEDMLLDYNCKSHLVRTQRSVFLDNKGGRVDAADGATTWDAIKPNSPDDQVSAAMCLISEAKPGEDIRAGAWRSLTRDKTREISILEDQVGEVDQDRVVLLLRSDFADYELLEGVPYRHLVTSVMVDCKRRLSGMVRNQVLIDWNRVVISSDVEKKDFKLEPIEPSSFLYSDLERICSAPRVQTAQSNRGSDDSAAGVSVGTAWATNKGYLVTASHVIDGGKKIEVYQNSRKIGEASVVGNDPANDVAVLKYLPSGGGKLRIIPLADKPGALGKSVFTLGFPAPDVMGQAIKMAAGDISATSGMQDDARFLQISIPIQQGNSGGPVIGFDGSAVGVVSAKLAKLSDERDGPRPENVNYAVKIAYVRPLLEELPDLADYTAIKVAGGTPEDLIAQAREAVFMLVVTAQ